MAYAGFDLLASSILCQLLVRASPSSKNPFIVVDQIDSKGFLISGESDFTAETRAQLERPKHGTCTRESVLSYAELISFEFLLDFENLVDYG